MVAQNTSAQRLHRGSTTSSGPLFDADLAVRDRIEVLGQFAYVTPRDLRRVCWEEVSEARVVPQLGDSILGKL